MSATLLPPYLLEAIAERGPAHAAACARTTLERDARMRTSRYRAAEARAPGSGGAASGPAQLREAPESDSRRTPAVGTDGASDASARPDRTVFDAQGSEDLPGMRVRGEGGSATGDPAADEAYDGLGATWELFFEQFGRDSLDGRGMPLLGTVHFGRDYANAFWDGRQMVFGDGDGELFHRFTASLDVIGHELAHGVIEFTAGLRYADQPGALNESIADVFGSLVRQRLLDQTAGEADWLIGAELFTERVQGRALRSMAAPGTAYDDPVLGRDPQPGHMDDFVRTQDDNGGVHINSGIPNRAFHLAATALGGRAWERAGAIWYAALTGPGIAADCDFAGFAALTAEAAAHLGTQEEQAVRTAWAEVGVTPADVPASGTHPAAGSADSPDSAAPGPAHGRDASVRLDRSGGFAGLSREREFRLGELPAPDAEDWERLLSGPELPQWEEEPAPQPDRYVYRVECQAASLHVRLPESRLPDWVRELFRRTLGG
ncbi:protealysin inhibitor emfourin [Brevibacterium album]|uniref:protealysin inhibitor emfourin n=1 Tax=Brevibacterium album TaxID=417948 RepID=UPI00041F0E22|nr:protealysin inhibitor emfourin [Brevibacterium album]